MRCIVILTLVCSTITGCINDHPENENKTVGLPASSAAITADSLGRFVAGASMMPLAEAENKLAAIITAVANDSLQFRNTIDLLSTPLSYPNSRFRNEDLYIRLLEAELNSKWYIDAEKNAIRSKLQLALQNRVGKPANDFSYLTPEGVSRRMYAIRAPYTLLYFYNPECHSCKDTKAQIESSAIITKNITSGRLKLFAIYTDLDETLWRRHLPENPKQWLNGRDTSEYLWKNKVYDLRAIPTLYLLDQKKNVLLKDATVPQIEEKLGIADQQTS